MVHILGINAYHGDASAALFKDGQLVAAVEEERLSRLKHAAGFPKLAICEVLRMGGIEAQALDHVAIGRDPRAHLGRKVLFALRHAPEVTDLVKRRLSNANRVKALDETLAAAVAVPRSEIRAQFHHVEHHRAHLASAFFMSGFDEAACLSIDGFGDFSSAMMANARGNEISVMDRVEFPHSAGMFYTAVTQFIGFPKYGEEWKMMGLAPYGRPLYTDQLSRVLLKRPHGKFELDLSCFTFFQDGGQMTFDDGTPKLGRIWSDKLVELLGPPRDPQSPEFLGRWADLAASAQAVYEDVFLHVMNHLQKQTGQRRVCLAGGCALNSVANGKIPFRTAFEEVYVQPAAADNGISIGAAAFVAFSHLGLARTRVMDHAYTGPAYSDEQVDQAVAQADLDGSVSIEKVPDSDLFARTAAAIAGGKVVGWFQGGMEFGPRALGNRSIVADPRRADMKDILNQRIKRRETFRPFAPSVLEERADELFEMGGSSPFMLMVSQVRPDARARIPAVTHVDHSARVQTVSARTNPRYHALIGAFADLTGVPAVLNTSFNEHEPIVCTPQQALACFMRTRMDMLVLGNVVLERKTSG